RISGGETICARAVSTTAASASAATSGLVARIGQTLRPIQRIATERMYAISVSIWGFASVVPYDGISADLFSGGPRCAMMDARPASLTAFKNAPSAKCIRRDHHVSRHLGMHVAQQRHVTFEFPPFPAVTLPDTVAAAGARTHATTRINASLITFMKHPFKCLSTQIRK